MSLVEAPEPRSRIDDRRAAILAIAREVFLSQGYAQASMSAIAARLGGSKGTLYNYFKNKEELFAAFMRAECSAEATVALAIENHDGDVRRSLCEVGARFVRFVLSEKAATVHRLVIAESGRFPELGRIFYEVGPRQALTRVEAFLAGEMAAGRLRPADPARAAGHFLALCKSVLHEQRLWGVREHPSDAEIDAHVDAAVDVFMAAYGPRAAAPR